MANDDVLDDKTVVAVLHHYRRCNPLLARFICTECGFTSMTFVRKSLRRLIISGVVECVRDFHGDRVYRLKQEAK